MSNNIMYSARKLMQCDMWKCIVGIKGVLCYGQSGTMPLTVTILTEQFYILLHYIFFADVTNGLKWPTICRKTSRHFYNENALPSQATWTPSARTMLMDSYRLNVNWVAWHSQRPISIWIKVMVLHKGAHTIKNTGSSPICPRPWCENEERLWHFGEYAPLTAMWGNLRVILKR